MCSWMLWEGETSSLLVTGWRLWWSRNVSQLLGLWPDPATSMLRKRKKAEHWDGGVQGKSEKKNQIKENSGGMVWSGTVPFTCSAMLTMFSTFEEFRCATFWLFLFHLLLCLSVLCNYCVLAFSGLIAQCLSCGSISLIGYLLGLLAKDDPWPVLCVQLCGAGFCSRWLAELAVLAELLNTPSCVPYVHGC